MKLIILFACSVVLCGCVMAHPVKYDQRQEGDLNVRTDVEDVVFVMVPPQDLVAAGMGLVAATAADLLRKNYGPIGPERWPLRTPSKIGFIPLEKSPYKVDLEKTGLKVKKIGLAGDPNRYNVHDTKTPTKASPEMKIEIPDKPVPEKTTETVEEMPSTTESKTVKKVLKPEGLKKTQGEEEKKKDKVIPEVSPKTEETKPKTHEKITEETKAKTTKTTDGTKTKVPEEITEAPLRVIGGNMDPGSILRLEGCGPDAHRDSSGKCVYNN